MRTGTPRARGRKGISWSRKSRNSSCSARSCPGWPAWRWRCSWRAVRRRRAGARTGSGAVALALGGVALVLALGYYSLTLGQVAGVGAAASAGMFIALIVRRGATLAPGGLTVPVLVGMLALVQGVVFADS